MSIEWRIICDGCGLPIEHCDQGIERDGRRALAIARRRARAIGARTNLPGGRDLCADCAGDEEGK